MLVGWLRPGVGYLVLFTRLEMCKRIRSSELRRDLDIVLTSA